MLGGRRLKTSKGRNRETEGRPRGPIYGDQAHKPAIDSTAPKI